MAASSAASTVPVLVLGADTPIGGSLCTRLIESGTNVVAWVRDARSSRIRLRGVRVIDFDMRNASRVRRALRGAVRMFVAPEALVAMQEAEGFRDHPHEIGGEVLAAARAAGMQRVVLLSSAGADRNSAIAMNRCYAEIERVAHDTHLDVVVLRAAALMQRWLAPHFANLVRTRVLAMPMRDAAINFVDARDAADVAACVLASGTPDSVLNLFGQRAWRYAEIATELGKIAATPIDYCDICAPRALGALERAGVPHFAARRLIEWWAFAAEGGLDLPGNGTIESWLGREPRTLEAYLRESLAASMCSDRVGARRQASAERDKARRTARSTLATPL